MPWMSLYSIVKSCTKVSSHPNSLSHVRVHMCTRAHTPPQRTPGFLNLGTVDIWSWECSVTKGHPVHWRMFSSTSGLHPLDASCPPVWTPRTVSIHCHLSPVGNHWNRRTEVQSEWNETKRFNIFWHLTFKGTAPPGCDGVSMISSLWAQQLFNRPLPQTQACCPALKTCVPDALSITEIKCGLLVMAPSLASFLDWWLSFSHGAVSPHWPVIPHCPCWAACSRPPLLTGACPFPVSPSWALSSPCSKKAYLSQG